MNDIIPQKLLLSQMDTKLPYMTPAEFYTSKTQFERERDNIFKKSWLNVGRIEAVKQPGDYVVVNLRIINTSVIICRGEDGLLRGFHNVCSHRAARVELAVQGNKKHFTCEYHGWVYDLKGDLRAVPGRGDLNFCDGLPDEGRLVEVSVDTWGGFIFINVDRTPRIPLKEYLSPLPDGLDRYLSGSFYWFKGLQCEVAANWKSLLEVQSEGYHLEQLHKQTIADTLLAKDCPGYAYPGSDGVTGIMVASRNPGGRQTPLSPVLADYGEVSQYTPSRANAVTKRDFPDLEEREDPNWVMNIYTFFPHVSLFIGDGLLYGQWTWPIAVDKTVIEWHIYYPSAPANFGQRLGMEEMSIKLRETISEDVRLLEGAQSNYVSEIKENLMLVDDRESAVWSMIEKIKSLTL